MSEIFNEFNNFKWNNIKMIDYKPENDSATQTFYNVTRQNIVESSSNEDIGFDVRYFECGIGGYTTLEKHGHAHIVMNVRGKGRIVVGLKVYDVKPMDLVIIPSGTPHQLINTGDEPYGFICTVNGIRDKFKLLNKTELDELKLCSDTQNVIRVPEGYLL